MSINKLKEFANSINIAHDLPAETLNSIGRKVLFGYTEDKNSMQSWLDDVKQIEELASLESKEKDFPFPKASNVKLPLITNACLQFNARVYPALFKDKKLVKYTTIGLDENGDKQKAGEKVANFMNYQLLIKDQDWETEEDRLLFLCALYGWICKKAYYDPIRNKICIKICDHKKVFVNSSAISLKDAARITEELDLSLNEIVARKNKEIDGKSVFLEEPVNKLYEQHKNDTLAANICFLEQQVDLDLDEDGISEPYIVTVLQESGEVFRISPRFYEDGIILDDPKKENSKILMINPTDYYVDYHCIPNPNGSYQSVGFGILLLYINHCCNSISNNLIDAGTLANMKCGFMDARLRVIPTGNNAFDMGEYKVVKVQPGTTLEEGIYHQQYGEPSSVLFQLLELLIGTAQQLSGSTEILSGAQSSQNAKTGATLALLQQGKATLDSIQKRIYRSLDQELKMLFILDSIYLDDNMFIEYAGGSIAIKKTDFDVKKVHVLPVADPNLSSDTERLAQAAFVQQIRQDPTIDPSKSMEFILASSGIPGIEAIMASDQTQSRPDPAMLKVQADIEVAGQKQHLESYKFALEHELEMKKLELQMQLAKGQLMQYQANSMALVAKAESLPVQNKLQDLALQFEMLSKKLDTQMDLVQMAHDKTMQQQDQEHQVGMQSSQQEHEAGMQDDQQQFQQQQAQQEPQQSPEESSDNGETNT